MMRRKKRYRLNAASWYPRCTLNNTSNVKSPGRLLPQTVPELWPASGAAHPQPGQWVMTVVGAWT